MKRKGSKKTSKYLDFVIKLEKLWKLKVAVIPIKVDALGTVRKNWIGNERKNRQHLGHITVEIGKDTHQNLGELWRLDVGLVSIEPPPVKTSLKNSQRGK